MRAVLALGGALVLAGCVAGDRVTLLDPAQDGKRQSGDVGSVAVISDEAAALSQEDYEARALADTDLEVLDERNEQALLRRRGPRVRTLDDAPESASLLADLPLEVVVEQFEFETGARELSPAVLAQLRAFLQTYLTRFNSRYSSQQEKPELHIEITGFADSDGYADLADSDPENSERNQQLSYRRATSVYYQLLAELGGDLPIAAENIDVVGAGDFAALRAANGARVANDDYRIVTVTVR